MPRHPHENDISIGQDRWIHLGVFQGDQARAVQIDPLLAPVMPFLDGLETVCVAGCCGIDAYGLWPEDIEKVLATFDPGELETLVVSLASVQNEIERLDCDTVLSMRMNQHFRRTAFLELWTHLRIIAESV